MKVGKFYYIKYKEKVLFGKVKEKIIYGELEDIRFMGDKKQLEIMRNDGWGILFIDQINIIDFHEVKDKWKEKIKSKTKKR